MPSLECAARSQLESSVIKGYAFRATDRGLWLAGKPNGVGVISTWTVAFPAGVERVSFLLRCASRAGRWG